jgi:hypothetical protein
MTARSTDLQFVPVLTSLLFASSHASFSAGRARLRHPTRAFTRGRPRHSPGAPDPIARRPSARQAFRLLRARLAMRCPGSGPSARSSVVSWTVPPVLPRVSARQPEPTAGWPDCPRLRSLLAANQWIAETSSVAEPILRGPSPHSLPIESLVVAEAKARPRSSRARKRGVLARQGTGWGQWPQAGSFGPGARRANEEASRRVGDVERWGRNRGC